MSFFHRCAVGLFEPSSLEIGKRLQVAQPLGFAIQGPLASTRREGPKAHQD